MKRRLINNESKVSIHKVFLILFLITLVLLAITICYYYKQTMIYKQNTKLIKDIHLLRADLAGHDNDIHGRINFKEQVFIY